MQAVSRAVRLTFSKFAVMPFFYQKVLAIKCSSTHRQISYRVLDEIEGGLVHTLNSLGDIDMTIEGNTSFLPQDLDENSDMTVCPSRTVTLGTSDASVRAYSTRKISEGTVKFRTEPIDQVLFGTLTCPKPSSRNLLLRGALDNDR